MGKTVGNEEQSGGGGGCGSAVVNISAQGVIAEDGTTNLNVQSLTTGRLLVNGASTTLDGVSHAYFGVGTGGVEMGPSADPVDVSITAVGAVHATQFVATSDARTKTGIKVANIESLATAVEAVPVRTWRYKDTVAQGSHERLGFVAQDIRDAGLEWALRRSGDYVPDVYRQAQYDPIRECYVLPHHGLDKGAKIRYYVQSIQEPCVTTVDEIIDDSAFTLQRHTHDTIFVFGSWAEDVMAVDYGALTAAAFAAIQQLKREVQMLKSKCNVE